MRSCHFYKEFFHYQNETYEVEDPIHSLYIVNSVFNAFSAYSAIMLNILSIHAMRKTSSLPKPLKTLLLSLAASDLGIGLLVQPLYITLLLADHENNQNCAMPTISFIIIWFFANASFLGILTISVDRFLAIHLHLRYQELVTHKRVVAVVISIWIFSAFLSLLDFWMASRAQSVTFEVFVTIFFGLCFICTAVVYCRIYFTVRRHRNEIQAIHVQAAAAQSGELGNVARQRKSSLGTSYVYLVFLICHLPEYCIFVASNRISEQSTILKGLIPCAWTLVFFNSSLNPLVYCWKMRQIRHTILDNLRNAFLKVKTEKSIV